jgi:hypothetical protein
VPLTKQSTWSIKRIIDRTKGLDKIIRVGGEGAEEFFELGFYNFKDCTSIKVIAGSEVGNIPRSVKDSAKHFGCWLALPKT